MPAAGFAAGHMWGWRDISSFATQRKGIAMTQSDCREIVSMSPFWNELETWEQEALIRELNYYHPELFGEKEVVV
jgi:hypothetical protein